MQEKGIGGLGGINFKLTDKIAVKGQIEYVKKQPLLLDWCRVYVLRAQERATLESSYLRQLLGPPVGAAQLINGWNCLLTEAGGSNVGRWHTCNEGGDIMKKYAVPMILAMILIVSSGLAGATPSFCRLRIS